LAVGISVVTSSSLIVYMNADVVKCMSCLQIFSCYPRVLDHSCKNSTLALAIIFHESTESSKSAEFFTTC